jgi:hypothetical protein
METISVFYSTTEDSGLTKYQQVFRDACEQVGRMLDVHLEVIYWRDVAGGLGSTAQSVIDTRIAGKYDVYFGIMGTHFGSGTAHEYSKAVEDHLKNGRPIYVCFGFCEQKANPFSIKPDSLAELIQFRADIGNGGKYGIANLYFTFADSTVFRARVETHLKHAINLIKGRVVGGRSFGV